MDDSQQGMALWTTGTKRRVCKLSERKSHGKKYQNQNTLIATLEVGNGAMPSKFWAKMISRLVFYTSETIKQVYEKNKNIFR